jgi:3-oxoadipate enol-lactonase
MRIRLPKGLGMAYRTRGAGRPIVLLHTLGTGAAMWDGVVEILRARFRCIAIDFRGYGDSDVPCEPFSLEDLADDVITMLRAQGLKDVVVVGCSMGGMVAQRIALAAPELLSGLVLAGAPASIEVEAQRLLRENAKVALNGVEPLAEATVARWFSPACLGSDSAAPERIRELFASLDPVVVSWSWNAVADTGERFHERLKDIGAPTALIVGTHDAAQPTMEAMAPLLPNGRLTVMPGVGHLAPTERPVEFAAFVEAFVATL